VRLTSYDINANGFPADITYQHNLPLIYFFPAFSKGPPFRQYTGAYQSHQILNFLKETSQNELTATIIEDESKLAGYIKLYNEMKDQGKSMDFFKQ